jgi:hypothetical protein
LTDIITIIISGSIEEKERKEKEKESSTIRLSYILSMEVMRVTEEVGNNDHTLINI